MRTPDTPAAESGDGGLPIYLRDWEPSGPPRGTLSYNRRRRMWQIAADDPHVAQLCKRLFPGTDRERRGYCYFPDHPRFVGDCRWLMMRFPLAVAASDRARWQTAVSGARQAAMERQRLLTGPREAEPLPGFFEGELMRFQREGLHYLLHVSRGLLADEMGLGKTVQALAALSRLGRYPALILTPPHLVTNWQREIARFLRVADAEGFPAAPQVHVFRGLTPYDPPEAHIYIIHYLLLRGWKRALPEMGFQTVVMDEVQELRHTGTEKYSAASLLSSSAERVYGLSGTPIYNYGGEIWNVMNVIDYHCLGDWEGFTREWCAGYGRPLLADPEALGRHLRSEGLMLRRTKADVLPELPPKRRVVQEIDSDEEIYEQGMQPVWEKIRSLMALTGGESAAALLRERIAQDERQATGLSKAPSVCAFARGLLEGGERVLLFAHHHSVFDIYRRELVRYRPVFLTGLEDMRRKDQAIAAFMEGRTNLCCVSLRAAAGLNLQRATCVVFGELDWSPAVHSQAEDRAHRIGQQDSILCYYLVCSRGSDQDMQDALGLKVSQFRALMGETDRGEEQRDDALRAAGRHIDRVIERLTRRIAAPGATGDGR
ncbi:MAG: DEAD/DEAH box helicase [Clostridiales bacterium]|nr:DEAD/DEAH box helicase [Clostridiales bacterium]